MLLMTLNGISSDDVYEEEFGLPASEEERSSKISFFPKKRRINLVLKIFGA